jgi:iron complex transport system substrate-binding protein
MKRERFLSLLLVVLFAFMLPATACNQNSEDSVATRTIVDMSGRSVEVPVKVERVFMDWAQGTLHMMTLGALDKVLAVRTAFEGEIFTWARLIDPNFDIVPKDDDPFTNIEALLVYEPDVVFTLYEDDAKNYESVGIPAVVVTFADYDQFRQGMQIIGDVLGEEYAAKAKRYNDFCTSNIPMVNERLADIGESDKKLIHYVVGRADSALFTRGYDQIEATWIEMAGGRYAARAFMDHSVELSLEQVLDFDPDIIFVGGHQQAASYKILFADPILSEMRAVKSGEVYRMPQGIFPWSEMGPEACMQIVFAAKTLYPDRFADVDIAQMAKGFYRDFIGREVSDEYIAMMLQGRLTPDGE